MLKNPTCLSDSEWPHLPVPAWSDCVNPVLSINRIFPFLPQSPLQNGLSLLTQVLQPLRDEPPGNSPLTTTVIQHFPTAQQPQPEMQLHSKFQRHPILSLPSKAFVQPNFLLPPTASLPVTMEIVLRLRVVSLWKSPHSPRRDVPAGMGTWAVRGPRGDTALSIVWSPS